MSETTSIEDIRAEIAELEAQLKDKKAELRALKPVKAKAEPKACGCGCGDLTRGGDFLPGHDARFRGQMLKAIDAGDASAIDALLVRPTLLHGATEGDLRARLGADVRKAEAHVARQVEAQEKRDAAKEQKDANARLKEESRQATRDAGEERLANKERARSAAKSGRIAA